MRVRADQHEAIRQLVARYALAVEHKDAPLLASLFAADADLRGYGERSDRAFTETLARSLSTYGVAVMHIGNHMIDLESRNRATGVVSASAELEVGARWIRQLIVYDDVYVRRNGRWFFTARRHQLVYGAPPGCNPLTLASADWPRSHEGWGDLRKRAADPPRPDNII